MQKVFTWCRISAVIYLTSGITHIGIVYQHWCIYFYLYLFIFYTVLLLLLFIPPLYLIYNSFGFLFFVKKKTYLLYGCSLVVFFF